jgi:hypothetical protein
MGKIFEEIVLKTFQSHFEDRNLLNASQFSFHTRHKQHINVWSLRNHVTLNIK